MSTPRESRSTPASSGVRAGVGTGWLGSSLGMGEFVCVGERGWCVCVCVCEVGRGEGCVRTMGALTLQCRRLLD